MALWLLFPLLSPAQNMVHPGLSHKKSDLDRMKYMVQAGVDPWKTSFDLLSQNQYASYSYVVRGNSGITTLVEPATTTGYNYELFKYDALAAYYNSLMWYVSGDERHAKKAVEIFKAWSNLRRIVSNGTKALDAGRVIWKMLEGAEIIKSTYSGWEQADIDKFKAMLVYPGYSATTEPSAAISSQDATFYWYMYNGDPGRHGNQGNFAMRGIMAMGIFMDNRVMYDRALRYMSGLTHRSDDLPYPSGPPIVSANALSSSNVYFNEFSQISPYRQTTVPDYGYNEAIGNYIWENGQCQESSRDQGHAVSGISNVLTICEMAWNQGDNLYSILDNRPLLGLEFSLRYNASYQYSFSDQPSPWEPTVENGQFIRRKDRSGRWESLKINPWNANDLTDLTRGQSFKSTSAPVHEMTLAHYRDRVGLAEEKYKWTKRVLDLSMQESGYEQQGFQVDHPGFGGLTFRRPAWCPGDPVTVENGSFKYQMNVLPGTFEAENFDHFQDNGQGKVYNELTASNTGGQYRTSEAVDIETCSAGGYNLTSLESGEWINYTVHVPKYGKYKIQIKYAAQAAGGKVKFEFAGTDKTGEVAVPFGGSNSNGSQDWKDFTVADAAVLSTGVQSMRISISGVSSAFNIDKIILSEVAVNQAPEAPVNVAATAGPTQVALSWSASAETTSYNVKRSTSSGGPFTTVASGITTNSYTNTALFNNTPYYFVITAVNAFGESLNSAVVTATPNGVDYYTKAGVSDITQLSSWNSAADASGSAPANFTTATSNFIVQSGHTVSAASAFTIAGSLTVNGTLTMSNTLTLGGLNVASGGVLNSTTVPAGSVFSLITSAAGTYTINGTLGAAAGSAVSATGSGIRIFVNGTGTTTFTGNGTVNIARLSPNSSNATNQTIIVDTDMELRNYAGSNVASLTLQNGSAGTSAKVFTLNAGKTIKLNGSSGLGAFHGVYFPAYGNTSANSSGSSMTYNINGTLDCSLAQFNLVTNQQTDGNVLTVNVNGKLKLGSTVRLFKYRAAQSVYVNVADAAAIDGAAVALNTNVATSGGSVNTSAFTGTAAVANGLAGVTFSGNNPVVGGPYAFDGTGGSGYQSAPTVFFTGGTLNSGQQPTNAIANISNGSVSSITVLSTGTYSVKPTGILLAGGGAPSQWFAINGVNQTGTVSRLITAGIAAPFWIGTSARYTPLQISPANTTEFIVGVKQASPEGEGVADNTKAINKVWSISPVTASGSTTLTFGYNVLDANANSNPAAAMMLTNYNTNSSAWEIANGTVSSTPVLSGSDFYQVTFSGLSSFNGTKFAVANSGILPLKLLSFNALATDAGVSLSWKTANEVNVKEFEIERSFDGKIFSTLKKLPASNRESNSYSFMDNFNELGYLNQYYRLKMVDTDGVETLSYIVAVYVPKLSGNTSLSIFPNPVKGGLLTVKHPSSATNAHLQIFSVSGNIVYEARIGNGKTVSLIDMTGFSSGAYLTIYKDSQNTLWSKFIKN